MATTYTPPDAPGRTSEPRGACRSSRPWRFPGARPGCVVPIGACWPDPGRHLSLIPGRLLGGPARPIQLLDPKLSCDQARDLREKNEAVINSKKAKRSRRGGDSNPHPANQNKPRPTKVDHCCPSKYVKIHPRNQRRQGRTESWAEHTRQHDRFTVADRRFEERGLSLVLDIFSMRTELNLAHQSVTIEKVRGRSSLAK
jgi:hypothetical protein